MMIILKRRHISVFDQSEIVAVSVYWLSSMPCYCYVGSELAFCSFKLLYKTDVTRIVRAIMCVPKHSNCNDSRHELQSLLVSLATTKFHDQIPRLRCLLPKLILSTTRAAAIAEGLVLLYIDIPLNGKKAYVRMYIANL
jgi:hypothetical protein